MHTPLGTLAPSPDALNDMVSDTLPDALCRVLIVDDDDIVRTFVRRMLLREGFEVDDVDNGDAMLRLLSQKSYDVVILDLRMPTWSGMDLLVEMRQRGLRSTPIMMSGYGDVQSAVEALKLGAFDFFEKPQDLSRIADAVRRAYRHHRLEQYADAMAETAGEWEATFNSVPDLIAVVSTQGRVLRINQAFANRLGRPAGTWFGRAFADLIPGVETMPTEWDPTAGPEGSPHELSVLYGNALGGQFLVTSNPLYSSHGRLLGYVHVARDVTRLKHTEDRLRSAHGEIQTLLSSLPYFVIGLNAEAHVTQWNTAAEQTFGLSERAALGRPVHECGIDWDWAVIDGALVRVLADQSMARLTDIRYRRPDGTPGVLELTINTVPSATHHSIVLLGVDITTRREFEVQLVQSQKLEAIGQLASGIAHEINTPVQYVGDNIRFIKDAFRDFLMMRSIVLEFLADARATGADPDRIGVIDAKRAEIDDDYLASEVPRALEESLEGIDRIAGILRAMKEFSHPGTEDKTPVDLNRAIESTITVARNEWKYVSTVATDFEPDLPMVPCLPGEINQVILNILINAVHAIKDVAGENPTEKGVIAVSTASAESYVEIRIRDTGSGIPDAVRERIFEPFFTTKDVGRGTGQGLAIARNVVVDKHGGTLTFETEMGRGTTFIIRLPVGV